MSCELPTYLGYQHGKSTKKHTYDENCLKIELKPVGLEEEFMNSWCRYLIYWTASIFHFTKTVQEKIQDVRRHSSHGITGHDVKTFKRRIIWQ